MNKFPGLLMVLALAVQVSTSVTAIAAEAPPATSPGTVPVPATAPDASANASVTKSYRMGDQAQINKIKHILIRVPVITADAAMTTGKVVLVYKLIPELISRSNSPAINIEKDFAQSLKSDLEQHGYQVSVRLPEAASGAAQPTNYADADAVMDITASADYSSPKFGMPYTRDVLMNINIDTISKGKRADPIFTSEYRYRNRQHDTYSYDTFDLMLKDAANAVDGLRKAVLGLAAPIAESLKKK